MIGAMPAVAVRHERRRQEKRTKRPSQLYLGGPWLPPPSPSPTPSPGQGYGDDDRFPEYYVCGKVSALQLVVGSLLLGCIVLVVGLVQLTPGAADADHRWILLGSGSALITAGLALTAVRCCCMREVHHGEDDLQPKDEQDAVAPLATGVSSIEGLVQRRDTQIGSPSELAALIPPDHADPGDLDDHDPHPPPPHPHSHSHSHNHNHSYPHNSHPHPHNNHPHPPADPAPQPHPHHPHPHSHSHSHCHPHSHSHPTPQSPPQGGVGGT